MVRLLLRARANINQLTNDLSCPLYAGMPCVHNAPMISASVCVFGWMTSFCIFFPLAAVDGGFEEIVELLVGKGAEVNGTHTASCWTCLHQAVYKVMKEAQIHVCDASLLLRYSCACVIKGSHPDRAHPGECVQPGGCGRPQDLFSVCGCSVWTEGVSGDPHQCRYVSVL